MRNSNWAAIGAAVASAALLAACGGGGGGGDAPATPAPQPAAPAPQATEQERSLLAFGVFFYDSSFALDRVLNIVGYDKLLGADGTYPAACPGGGTATLTKAGGTAVLAAATCVPSASDPLVYGGQWTLPLAASTYAPDGTCAAGNCALNVGNIDESQARAGYGTANQRAGGGIGMDVRTANGVRTVTLSIDSQFVIDGQVLGTTLGTVLRAPGSFTASSTLGGFNVTVATERQTLSWRAGNLLAVLQLGADVEAKVNRRADGSAGGFTATLPWSYFVD